jgi:membrane protein DedA with SNARE-associated domain
LGIALAVATLVSEDAALITGSLLVGNDMTSTSNAIFWLTFGIAGGDVLLYGVGSLARESRWLRRKLPVRKARSLKRWLEKRQTAVLFSSRFLPGTRLPTYLTFGYFRLSLTRFTIVMTVAAVAWVTGMILFVNQIQQLLSEYDDTVGIIGGAVFAFAFIFVVPALVRKSARTEAIPEPATDGEACDPVEPTTPVKVSSNAD